jgi:hypothetical protein
MEGSDQVQEVRHQAANQTFIGGCAQVVTAVPLPACIPLLRFSKVKVA